MTEGEGPGSGSAAENLESVSNFSALYRLCIRLFLFVYILPLILYNYLVFGLRIRGRKNLRRTSGRGVILVSNHTLYFDPAILIHTLLPRRAYYTALKSHFHNPVARAFMRIMGGIPIPDRWGMRKAEQTVRQALELGYSVHFFPEGEMTHMSQQPKAFKTGAFYMAVRLQASIVPVTIVHRPRRLFGRVLSPHFIRVTSVVGEPVEATCQAGESARQAAERLAEAVRNTVLETISQEYQKP